MKKVYRSTVTLAVIMFLTKLIAFARDVVLANCYGASYVSDAFLVAISIPTVLFSGIAGAVFTCYIPVYKELKVKSAGQIKKFNGSLMSIALLLSCLGVILYQVFDDIILKVFAVGFDSRTFELAKEMSQIMVPVMVFMGATCILQGYLQANECFYLVGAMTIPTNIIIALSIGFSTEKTLLFMAWGTVAGYAVHLLYFGIPAYKKGFRLQLQPDFQQESVRRLFAMVLPVFLGQVVFEINAVVDKSVASLLPAGGITALDYSFKLVSVIHSSLVAPISTVIYPKFSEYVVEGSLETLKGVLNKTLRMVEVMVIPIVAGVMVLARPVVEVLFFRGAFTGEAVRLTAESLVAYALAVLPISLRIICEKVFYARKETKVPMLHSMVGIAVNIVLDIILVRSLAHVGLALATSVSSAVTFFLFFASLRKRMGGLGGRKILRTGINSAIAAGIMSLCVHYCSRAFSTAGNVAEIVLCTLVGMAVYLVVMLLLREKTLIEFFQGKRLK